MVQGGPDEQTRLNQSVHDVKDRLYFWEHLWEHSIQVILICAYSRSDYYWQQQKLCIVTSAFHNNTLQFSAV